MEDLMWYVATRKDSKANFMFNENYLENYENEFENIREFDTPEDARAAYDAREAADREMLETTAPKTKIKAGKIRGEIRRGSLDEEEMRNRLRKEIEAEMALKTPSEAAKEAKKPPAKVSTKPSKAILK